MKLKTVFFLFVCISCNDQLRSQSNECGFGSHAFSDNYIQWYQNACLEANMSSDKRNQSRYDTIFTIKVVFHLIYPNYTILSKREFIGKWMDEINKDFNRKNPDSMYLRNIFKSRAGNPKIQFILADKDPQGNPSQGYTFTKSDKFFGVLPGTPFKDWHGMKFDSLGGKSAWNTSEYLNIWVCNNVASDGKYYYGAFATPPNQMNFWSPTFWPDKAIDGIVMGYSSYETNSRSSTLTHEIGHYLGLRHVSGDANYLNLTCTLDDYIFDTPKILTQNFNCDFTINSCKDSIGDLPDMLENFMDYTYCRNSFTQGQVNVMRYALATLRSGLAGKKYNKTYTDTEFRVYPTLTENFVNIDFDEDAYKEVSVQLFNLHGQLIVNKKMTKADSIDLSQEPPGTYFIKVFLGVSLLNQPIIIMKY